MKIDLFEFARQGRTEAGRVPLSQLPRIETPEPAGVLAWSATGSTKGRHGGLRLDLTVTGDVVLICQRCLKPMTETLDLRPRFLIAPDDDTADALDQDDEFDVVVGSPTFELETLIEDEVILALPIAPRHAVCPDGAGDADATTRRPSPFAVLEGLRIGGKPPDGPVDG